MNVPVKPPIVMSEVMESVLLKGDLGKLTPQERVSYYGEVCKSIGLNPLTKPFEYITLNGKLTLYALRACTDQLRGIHNVSVVDLTETERDGVIIVTAKVRNGEGRTDMAKGAVNIDKLKGDALANAIMKAETKAKRRATLSLCGLGFLDETEIETIPAAATMTKAQAREPYKALQDSLDAVKDEKALSEWYQAHAAEIASLPADWKSILRARYNEHLAHIKSQKDEAPPLDDMAKWFTWLESKLAIFKTAKALENYWNTTIEPLLAAGKADELDRDMALNVYARHAERIEAETSK